MYKIVALDLDDTLLNNKKEISERNKKALKACEALGVKIVIATGRPYVGIQKVLKDLDLIGTDTYAICFNGALIYSLKDNSIIHSATLKGKEIKEIYQESLKQQINFHAFTMNQTLITPKHNEYTYYEAKINHIEPHQCDFNAIDDEENLLKCMMVDPEPIVTKTIPKIPSSITDKYAMFRSAPFFLEFLNKEATKGNALLFLADYLKINPADTIAMGDSENDLSMIIAAGLGVAMENSYDHIKEKANYITKTNEDDGVAYVLENFILNK